MKSRVYLAKDFLKYMIDNASLANQSGTFEITQESINYQKIRQIISGSNLHLEYSINDIKTIMSEDIDSMEAQWLKSIIKSPFDKSFDESFDYSNPYSIYFEGNIDCTAHSDLQNVLCKGVNYDFKKDFFKSPLRTVFDRAMKSDDISNTYHHCRNIILIDPYIFVDKFKKFDSFIYFAESCFNFKNDKVQKHISIVTEFPTSGKDLVENKTINKYRKQISEALSINIENITVLRHLNNEFKGNRHLITDYALMDLQHVFDRDEGVISGLYIYNNKIDDNIIQANKLINKLKNLCNSTTEKHVTAADQRLKHNNFKFGDILSNPLFS